MKKLSLILLLWGFSVGARAQVGLNCQYIPGLQFGSVKVKTDNPALGDYKYGAGVPIMMLDRVGKKWYWNLDMNALYYGATQMNKANAGKIKIAKTEGGYLAGRMGRVFGKGELMRIGFSLNWGWSVSNLDSNRKAFGPKGYANFGGGLLYYQKIGKIRFVGKFGYEKIAAKKYIQKAKGLYVETTFAYMIYQRFGLSVMPCWYSKSFTYTPTLDGTPSVLTEADVRSFVLRLGITKFL